MDAKLQRRVQRYGWDRTVEVYERYWRAQLRPAQTTMLDRASLLPGERVLDVACGTGLVSLPAAGMVGESGTVVGTDISEKMIADAASRARNDGCPNVRFERMDAEDLAVEDRSFDAALCGLGLMYFPDPIKALAEMRRALVRDGRASVAVWGQRSRCGWADIFPIVDVRVESDVCPLFFQLGTGDALGAAMTAAGFAEVRVERLRTTLHYGSADDACGAAFAGGPVAMANARFDERTRGEAHAEYVESISSFRRGDAYEIPGEFVIACGWNRESA